jgi:hypothetical protein
MFKDFLPNRLKSMEKMGEKRSNMNLEITTKAKYFSLRLYGPLFYDYGSHCAKTNMIKQASACFHHSDVFLLYHIYSALD